MGVHKPPIWCVNIQHDKDKNSLEKHIECTF